MSNASNNSFTLMGTIGGIFATLIGCIDTADVLKTVVLSVIGAVVSVLMSLFMKRLLQRFRKS